VVYVDTNAADHERGRWQSCADHDRDLGYRLSHPSGLHGGWNKRDEIYGRGPGSAFYLANVRTRWRLAKSGEGAIALTGPGLRLLRWLRKRSHRIAAERALP